MKAIIFAGTLALGGCGFGIIDDGNAGGVKWCRLPL